MPLPAPFDRLRLPLIGSPLFIVSGPELVIAQCKAGIIGSFPALNARPQTLLDEWLHQITEELAKHNRENPDRPAAPFAVNQIVHKTNDRIDADMATCEKWQVPMVITSLGAREEVYQAVKNWGGITMHDVINNRFAMKAIEKGATGLIPVAAGAGGHAGALSPFALMQEIREWFDGLVALSGSIAHGASILGAQALRADFAYSGSAFIATEEANADAAYKQGIVEGDAFVVSLLGAADCHARAVATLGYQALATPGSSASLLLTGMLTLFVAVWGYRMLLGETPGMRDGEWTLDGVAPGAWRETGLIPSG